MRKVLCFIAVLAALLMSSCSANVELHPGDGSVYVSDTQLAEVEYIFAFRQNEKSFSYAFDKALADMKSDGAMEKIISAWTGAGEMCVGSVGDEPQDDGSVKAESEKERCIVGYVNSYYPFSWRDAYNTAVGLDIDIMEEAARRAGFTVEFTDVDVGTRESALESGKIDILISAYEYTDERAERFSLTEPYLTTSLRLMSKAGKENNTLEDLRRKKIAASEGTVGELLVSSSDVPFDTKYFSQTCYHSYYRVKEGRYDAAVIDGLFAAYLTTGKLIKQ